MLCDVILPEFANYVYTCYNIYCTLSTLEDKEVCKNDTLKQHALVGESYYNIEQQITLLQERKLYIEDTTFAHCILKENSYTSFIKYYGTRFLVDPQQSNSDYRPGATLNEIYALYTFNRKLSALYLEYILLVERILKTTIADYFASKYTPIEYWNVKNYSDSAQRNVDPSAPANRKTRLDGLLQDLREEIDKKCDNMQNIKDTPFERYTAKDKREKIPIWLLVNILSFGTIRRFFNCLKQKDKLAISNEFGLTVPAMENAFALLNAFRNSCAHDERIFDFYNKRFFKIASSEKKGKIQKTQTYFGVYAITRILKHFISSEHFIQFYTRLNECFTELQSSIHTITLSEIKRAMRFPSNEDLVFAELGRYNDGIILSVKEFHEVVTRYILPLIPQARLEPLHESQDGVPWIKNKSMLIEFFQSEERFYFSQSNSSYYTLRTEPLTDTPSTELIHTVQNHLQELISNLQIVWNTKKASALKPRELKHLFSTNTEIAYQLSICSLLTAQEAPALLETLNEKRNEVEHSIQTQHDLSETEKNEMRESVRKIEAEYAQVFSLERKQRETLYCILARLDQWAQKTYEGRHMPFGVIVNREIPEFQTFDYVAFLGMNYSATISDGLFSCVEVFADGSFCAHIPSSQLHNELCTIPYPHQGFAFECQKGKVGILLTTEGDIIIIADQKMVCSKHNGHWTYNQFDIATQTIQAHLSCICEEKRLSAAQSILSTLIDVAYSHGGACLAISYDNPPNTALLRMTYPTLLNNEDRLLVEQAASISDGVPLQENEKETDPFRMTVLQHLVGENRDFTVLNAYLRRELLEMDGALILGPDGIIHAVASIVNTNGASVMSGARTTAAIRLSKFGLAIKVSQDGYMKFYEKEKEILSI